MAFKITHEQHFGCIGAKKDLSSEGFYQIVTIICGQSNVSTFFQGSPEDFWNHLDKLLEDSMLDHSSFVQARSHLLQIYGSPARTKKTQTS